MRRRGEHPWALTRRDSPTTGTRTRCRSWSSGRQPAKTQQSSEAVSRRSASDSASPTSTKDPAAADRVVALNDGHRVTPTLVFGDDRFVVAEPTLERLGELLASAGYAVEMRISRVMATLFHG